jgi:crossover junction endodeoxyribonuclease RusA
VKLTADNLPVPPSLNHAYATVRGRRVLSAEGRQYKASAGLLIRYLAAQQGFTVPEGARLALTARFYFANKLRDGDNAVKLLQDAVAEALGFNDRCIKEWHIYGDVDKALPRCSFELAVLD